MKKLFYFSVICLFLYGKANASDFNTDITQQINSFRVSDEFVRHLSNCTPYKEEKTSDLGITSTYTYQIFGMVDGKCKCTFSNTSQMGNTVNNCNFTPESLKDYTDVLIRYNQKEKHFLEDMADENYVKAMGILFNPDICNMEISNDLVDFTADLRKHLQTCTPYEKRTDAFNIIITMKIYGKEKGKCRYSYSTERKPVDLNKLYPNGIPDFLKNIPQVDSRSVFDCLFTAEDTNLYINSLKKAAISLEENDNSDAEAPQRQLIDFSEKGICRLKGNMGAFDFEQ